MIQLISLLPGCSIFNPFMDPAWTANQGLAAKTLTSENCDGLVFVDFHKTSLFIIREKM